MSKSELIWWLIDISSVVSHFWVMSMCYSDDNSIDGDLPVIGANSRLKILSLSGVGLTGKTSASELLQTVGDHRVLFSLIHPKQSTRMSAMVTGVIPSSLGQSGTLIDIDLSRNFLEGPIPGGLGFSTSLRVLKLQSNNLDGDVPDSLATSSYLQVLNLGANELSGFSSMWYDLNAMDASSLMVLRLANNRIEVSNDHFEESIHQKCVHWL